MKIIARLFFVALLIASLVCGKVQRHNLTNWQFTVAGKFDNKSYSAKVPSTIHLDLLEHKLLEDPFKGTKANDAQWLAAANITYKTTFDLPATDRDGHTQLVFEGLDTYSKVLLNGVPILNTSNAFIKYTTKVVLKPGNNTIEVKFEQSVNHDNNEQAKDRLPFAYGHTRKAAYQHGWDWAPSLVTVGIWKDVYILSGIKTARLDWVWIRNRKLGVEEATVNIAAVLKSFTNISDHTVKVMIDDKDYGLMAINNELGTGYLDVIIKQPRYWWPRNVGTPNTYEFTFVLYDQNDNELDRTRQLYGIRTAVLNTTGSDFQFIINGHPVYGKGANYVPADMFHPRFTNPQFSTPFGLKDYMDTIEQSNYNMIRVWGGGQYQSNEFYQECTRRGIMVFQDFMYSVNIYPGSQPFLRTSEEEVKQQVRRLRNFACIVLWSGNNQILQGILSWGWGAPNYRKNYDLLFEKLIPKILENESPDISYIPSSPQYGAGGGNRGDIHYWSVWAGGAGFASYESSVGKFNSEFGTQAFPVYETITDFAGKDALGYESQVLLFHEKHNSRFGTLRRYIQTYMQNSTNWQKQVFQSSLVQAFGVGIAIQAQRSKRPFSWGTLYWQFNDAWPGISWSSMDYFGRWKALQYYAKRLYSDVAVMYSFHDPNRSGFIARIVNDKLYDVECSLTIKIITTDGKVLLNEHSNITVKTNEALKVKEVKSKEITDMGGLANASNIVVYAAVTADNVTSTNTFILVDYKNLKLEKAKLSVKCDLGRNILSLRTDKFLKNLFIDLKEGRYLKLSDNYMDLLPDEELELQVKGNLTELKDQLQFKSYRESYLNEPLEVELTTV